MALLVNVDSAVLSCVLACVLDDPEKPAVIEPIGGFRSLDEDMQAIVNKLEHVESVRKSGERLSKTQKGMQVDTQGGQQKPVKFATRIPFSRACPISVREQKQPLWKTSLSGAHGSCRYSGSYAFIGTSDGQSESRPR